MPKYLFTGAFPRVLSGLQEGVNAHRDGTPVGATIEAHEGDTIVTAAPYEHPELRLEDENGGFIPNTDGRDTIPASIEPTPVVPIAPTPAPAQGDVVLTPEEIAHLAPEIIAQIQAAAHPDEPAHTDMTAEGAPAPDNH